MGALACAHDRLPTARDFGQAEEEHEQSAGDEQG